MIHRIHVDVLEEDCEEAQRRNSHGCMIHRAIMRAAPGLFAPGQLEITGFQDLDWYIGVSPYSNVEHIKKGINHPDLHKAEEQNARLRKDLSEAPLWNRAFNPRGTLVRFGNLKGRATGLGREDINLMIEAWDAGYTVPAFSFDFEVETRAEWDYHQMDLFPWYEYVGVSGAKELYNQIEEALLAEKWGGMEEEKLPEMALAI